MTEAFPVFPNHLSYQFHLFDFCHKLFYIIMDFFPLYMSYVFNYKVRDMWDEMVSNFVSPRN